MDFELNALIRGANVHVEELVRFSKMQIAADPLAAARLKAQIATQEQQSVKADLASLARQSTGTKGANSSAQPNAAGRGKRGSKFGANSVQSSALHTQQYPSFKDMDKVIQDKAKALGLEKDNTIEICGRTRALIESLWEEMHVSQRDREEFSRHFFFPESYGNYMIVFKEVSKLLGRRSIHHRVLTYIELREGFLISLAEISRRLNMKSNDKFIVHEVMTLIRQLRTCTVYLVESILDWRYSEGQKPSPFYWNGLNYMIKMQTDCDFLKTTEVTSLFEFSLERNPLILAPIMEPSSPRTLLPDIHAPASQANEEPLSARLTGAGSKKSMFSTPKPSAGSSSSSSSHRASLLSSVSQASKGPEKLKKGQLLKDISIDLDLERVRRGEKAIFEEEAFLAKLLRDERRERAALRIQCVARGHLARKRVKHRDGDHGDNSEEEEEDEW